MFNPQPKIINLRSDDYKNFIRGKVCIVPNCSSTETEPHHESLGLKGIGMKAPDTQTVPMCRKHHNLRTAYGPSMFNKLNIDIKITIIRLQTEYIALKA